MNQPIEVAIIGAGPYGLSLAAQLRGRGVSHRIFGRPMDSWLTQMPKGMLLKSAGFASTLYGPGEGFTLERFCADKGIRYADVGVHIGLDTFTEYGQEFQKRQVPGLEAQLVASVAKTAAGFELVLESGERVSARKVVVAVGISHFGYVPPELASLGREFVTHTSDHNDLAEFRGRDVAVIGAGASAIDTAALLGDAGAKVQVVARKTSIDFPTWDPEDTKRSLLERIRKPMTGVGTGWKSVFIGYAPQLFRLLPVDFRIDVVKRFLGPAPGHFVREKVVGKMPLHLGYSIQNARVDGGRVALSLAGVDGSHREVVVDHVIAGTGYQVNLERLAFLGPEIRNAIRLDGTSPALSPGFESSVKGLYFIGLASAVSFGPMLRFAYGAGYASRHLSRHLARTAARAGKAEQAVPAAASNV